MLSKLHGTRMATSMLTLTCDFWPHYTDRVSVPPRSSFRRRVGQPVSSWVTSRTKRKGDNQCERDGRQLG